MKYFIDFDRTIFDTDAFKRELRQHPTVLELLIEFREVLREFFGPTRSDTRRQIFLRTWGTFLSHGRFAFNPEQLRTYLYSDVAQFFASNDCTIVTYGVRAFITAKVTTALKEIPVTQIVYTSRKKGRTLKQLTIDVPEPCVFIDDMLFQLESVAKCCPNLTVIEMRRDNGVGDGRWKIIRSLTELT